VRNRLIIKDVLAAVVEGRSPIILSERTDHVKDLADRLSPHIPNVIAMTGGAGAKKSREVLKAITEIPENEPFALVATGKYVGEGFDMPRLDTLFLAMPISWKGTVQQYVGRLHRLYEGKKEVQVYDYVDVREPMLERMHQRRLKGYAAIGYKAKGAPAPSEEVQTIFDSQTFFPVYSTDILSAQHEILISSPFLTKRRVEGMLNYLSAAEKRITVITKAIENYPDKDRAKIRACIDLLGHYDVTVKTKENLHQRFAIIDQRIVWYGSIHLLGYGTQDESMMRVESVDIAAELMEMVQNIGELDLGKLNSEDST